MRSSAGSRARTSERPTPDTRAQKRGGRYAAVRDVGSRECTNRGDNLHRHAAAARSLWTTSIPRAEPTLTDAQIYALLAIVDMIATATAESRDSKVLESLRRIKQSLNILKVDDPRLPLGD